MLLEVILMLSWWRFCSFCRNLHGVVPIIFWQIGNHILDLICQPESVVRTIFWGWNLTVFVVISGLIGKKLLQKTKPNQKTTLNQNVTTISLFTHALLWSVWLCTPHGHFPISICVCAYRPIYMIWSSEVFLVPKWFSLTITQVDEFWIDLPRILVILIPFYQQSCTVFYM